MNIQEQILAGLQQKFTGADTATLTRIAAKKAEGVTDEAQVNSIVEGVSFSDVLNSYGDFRASEASRTSVANYERKYNLKDGKAVEQPAQEPPKNNEPDISKLIAEAVSAAVKPLTEKIEATEAAKAQAERMEQILAKAKEYGIPETQAKRFSIAPDADLDAYFKDVKQEYANIGFSGVVPPASAEQKMEEENSALAGMIAAGTKQIVEQRK